MALTAACLATLKEPELKDYVASIQMAVKELQQWRAFHVKYDRLSKECVASQTMDTDSLPEVRNHKAYVEILSALLHAERISGCASS